MHLLACLTSFVRVLLQIYQHHQQKANLSQQEQGPEASPYNSPYHGPYYSGANRNMRARQHEEAARSAYPSATLAREEAARSAYPSATLARQHFEAASSAYPSPAMVRVRGYPNPNHALASFPRNPLATPPLPEELEYAAASRASNAATLAAQGQAPSRQDEIDRLLNWRTVPPAAPVASVPARGPNGAARMSSPLGSTVVTLNSAVVAARAIPLKAPPGQRPHMTVVQAAAPQGGGGGGGGAFEGELGREGQEGGGRSEGEMARILQEQLARLRGSWSHESHS